jgi:hypothetical protein
MLTVARHARVVTTIVGAAGTHSTRSSLGLRPWGSGATAAPTYVTPLGSATRELVSRVRGLEHIFIFKPVLSVITCAARCISYRRISGGASARTCALEFAPRCIVYRRLSGDANARATYSRLSQRPSLAASPIAGSLAVRTTALLRNSWAVG